MQCQKAEQLNTTILEEIKSTFLLRNFFQLSSLVGYLVQHKIDLKNSPVNVPSHALIVNFIIKIY